MDYLTIENSLTSFDLISELIANNEIEEIIKAIAKHFDTNVNTVSDMPMGGYSKGKSSGCYYYVLKDLKENLQYYIWLNTIFADNRSKEVFLNLMRYRVLPTPIYLKNACDKDHDQYFDQTIVHCDENEVFVDCGGFVGGTIESFIKNYSNFKHIYTYEPYGENYKKCLEAANEYPNVSARPFGIGKKEDVIRFPQSSSSSSFVAGRYNTEVDELKITSLDIDIKEPVSFIKMDIEGFEIDALIGAKHHIANDYPKLAICVYNIISDIWEIPKLICDINPDYNFFIRHYSEDQNKETVIYAVPKEKKVAPRSWTDKKQIGVYSMRGSSGFWRNQQLTKDCGAVPYLFYKKYGYRAVMVGKKVEEYPYLETYVKGMNMDFVPDESIETRCQYILDNYQSMDIFILFGPYPHYYLILNLYRKLRPDGKVYLALDANSHWMDRINWDNPKFIQFMNQCDIIATSCKKMQKHLSIKWPYIIDYIPNGYYNFSDSDLYVNLSSKENIILTVGRIGTSQKQNQVLMEAFANAYNQIPGWVLKLAGEIESSFLGYIDRYFEKYPHLKSKVIFTGLIENKSELLSEYQKSKIFALTSSFEGGTPNVVSEALFSGCYMITSDIDAAEDVTNCGICGQVFPIGNMERLTQIIIDVCNNQQLISKCARNAIEYAHRVYDFEKIVDRLHYLLFTER